MTHLIWENVADGKDHYGRGRAFARYACQLPVDEYWRGLGDTWQDCERQDIAHWYWGFYWTRLHRNHEERWQYVMTDGERAQVNGLPARVTVYRGVNPFNKASGLSWTLDRDVAHWFANRFSVIGPGYVIRGTVLRHRILALFDRRKESEVVVPPKYIYARSYEQADLEACARRMEVSRLAWTAGSAISPEKDATAALATSPAAA